MKTFLYIVVSLAVVGLAFWAYRENYATQQAVAETSKLHRDIRAAHARLAILKAEWAYLNRPDRLRELADLNFERLQLLPLRSDQFGHVDQVPFPAAAVLPVTNPIDVSSDNDPNRTTDAESYP
ncbi:MAG: cell division protein FtsL [Aliishimia sp.]